MRRLGPWMLLAVVVVLSSSAWLILHSGSTDLESRASDRPFGQSPANADAASANAGSDAERKAEATDVAKAPAGPNSVRGRVRFAADDRPAAGVRVRAFANRPPLRIIKMTQAMQRMDSDRPPAAVQDLADFGPNQGDRGSRSARTETGAAGGESDDVAAAAEPAATAKPEETAKPPAEKGPPTSQAPLATVTTQADGSFEITGRSEKELYLDALTAGNVSDRDEHVDFAASTTREGVVLSLVPGARLGGHVHDEEGRPVADATISISVGFDPFSVFSSGGLEICIPAFARTDAQGAWLFEALPAPRSLNVAASADAFAPSPAQKVELKPGDERTVDLLLAHGATLLVHVTDETGAPATDARCHLEPTRFDFANITTDLAKTLKNKLTPDADGRVRFTGVAAGEWRVRATAKGRLEDSKVVTAAGPGSELQVELRLSKGRTLTGVVVASDGAVVEQASVSAYLEPSLMNFQTMTRAGERRFIPADAQGRFTVAGLPEGKLVCEARAKGYRDGRMTLEKDATECRIELTTRGAIEGIVVSKKNGKPVTRFDVKVAREKKLTGFMDPSAAETFFDVTVPFASPNGKFRLAGVNSGRLKLHFHAADHGEQSTEWLDISDGETRKGVVVFLEAEAVVEGVVVEAVGGAPVEGASVARDAGANPIEAMMSQIFMGAGLQSDAQGRFRIGGLAAGTARFVATKEGFVEASTGDLELVAGQTTSTVRLELARGGEIWGVVNDPEGAPQPGASVMCQDTARLKMHTVKSDERGEYHVKGLAAGTFAVTRMPAKMDLGQENFITEMTNSIETHSVKLKAGEVLRIDFTGPKRGGATLEGRVTQGGAAVAGAIVNVFSTAADDPTGASGLKSATTSADGTFTLASLTAGSGFVQVNGPDFGMDGGASAATQSVRLVEGETTRVDLVIPTGGLRGKVVDAATGAALSGVAVYAASAEPGANLLELATRRAAAVHTDANGVFVVKHLRSGRYVLTAGGSDLMTSTPADHAVVRTAPLDVTEGREGDAGTIRLPEGGRVEGTVTDHAGKGLSGASVFLRGGDGEFLEEWTATSSDASGHFAYGGVPNGVWDVVARAPGHAVAAARGIRVAEGVRANVRIELLGGTEVFADIGEVSIDRLFSLKVEVEGPDGRIPLTLFGLGDLTDLIAHPPRADVVRLGRFGPGEYRVHGVLGDKSFEKKFVLKGEPELHIPVELPH